MERYRIVVCKESFGELQSDDEVRVRFYIRLARLLKPGRSKYLSVPQSFQGNPFR